MPHLTVDARMIALSGIGMVIRHILKRLPEHLPDWQITLIGEKAVIAEQLEHADAFTVMACSAPIYSLKEQKEVPKAIPDDTDLLWCPHYVIPLLYKGKMVVTVHDVCHLAWSDYRNAWHKRLYAGGMLWVVGRKAARVIADSDFTKAEIARYTPIPLEKVQTILCGVDEAWFEVTKPPVAEVPYLLYVGNVKPHKNLLRLLHAFEKVKDDIPHTLTIVGRREGFIHDDKEVADYAGRLGDRVRFTGFVSDEELKTITAGAEMLVMPSLYEGFGLPPLEAMACGVPVVCSDAASLPEVCGDAALMMDAHRADEIAVKIRQLVMDEVLRAQLIEKGKTQARQLSWDTAARAYAEVFKNVVG